MFLWILSSTKKTDTKVQTIDNQCFIARKMIIDRFEREGYIFIDISSTIFKGDNGFINSIAFFDAHHNNDNTVNNASKNKDLIEIRNNYNFNNNNNIF